MASIPESTKTSLIQRLDRHAEQRWPQIDELTVHYRGAFAYIDARLADGNVQKLGRLGCPLSIPVGIRDLAGEP